MTVYVNNCLKKIIENLQQIYRKDNLISIIEISEKFQVLICFKRSNLLWMISRSLIVNVGVKDFLAIIEVKV